MALNLELAIIKNGATIISPACTEEPFDTIMRTTMNYVGTTSTEDMEGMYDELSEEAGQGMTVHIHDTWQDFHEAGFIEQMASDGVWAEKASMKDIFGEDENESWTIELDLDNEFIRFYSFGQFAGSFDFVELDGMTEKSIREKCEEIAANGATVGITKLTMGDCVGIKRGMKQQTNMLEKLFKAIQEGKEHPRLLDGIFEGDIAFAENYCQEMMNACTTLSAIAENAEKILKPIEEAQKKAAEAKRKAAQDLKTDEEEGEGKEKPKKRKRRSPRKKKAASVKIAQTETTDEVVEEVVEETEDGENNAENQDS